VNGAVLPQGAGAASAVDHPWGTPAPPVVCMGGGMVRLAEPWLVAAGGTMAINLASLPNNGPAASCGW
jgi:hypothetical protein